MRLSVGLDYNRRALWPHCDPRKCTRRPFLTERRCMATQGLREESDAWKAPIEVIGNKPAIIALGKFDALHKGHRSLVERAAALGGYPWLLTFSGMADVLGWPKRPPLVPQCHRSMILETWAPYCQGLTPKEHSLPFDKVRTFRPQEFVDLLVEMQVAGAVVGRGFKFGYKQEGTADLLKSLGTEAGLKIDVLDLVGASTPGVVGNVSSTEVRRALTAGKTKRLEDYLGRRYHLLAVIPELILEGTIRIPIEAFRNQLPAQRQYNTYIKLQYSPGREVKLKDCNFTVEEHHVTLSHDNLLGTKSPVADVAISIWL